jgi:hypothetical protein
MGTWPFRTLHVVLLSAVLRASAAHHPCQLPTQDPIALPGESADVSFDPEADAGRCLRILVPQSAIGLAIATEDATLDVELYARRAAPTDLELGLWDAASASAWIDEELFLSRAELLTPGLWFVLVPPA